MSVDARVAAQRSFLSGHAESLPRDRQKEQGSHPRVGSRRRVLKRRRRSISFGCRRRRGRSRVRGIGGSSVDSSVDSMLDCLFDRLLKATQVFAQEASDEAEDESDEVRNDLLLHGGFLSYETVGH